VEHCDQAFPFDDWMVGNPEADVITTAKSR
jgi:hypothetical protein